MVGGGDGLPFIGSHHLAGFVGGLADLGPVVFSGFPVKFLDLLLGHIALTVLGVGGKIRPLQRLIRGDTWKLASARAWTETPSPW